MRVSVALFLISLLGMEAGAALVGLWCVGVSLIGWSAALGAYALLRNVPDKHVAKDGSEEQHFIREVIAHKVGTAA
jgi:hypothetical protein